MRFPRLSGCPASSAAEVGRRETMAGSPAAPAVGRAPGPAARRAVLRRTRGHVGTDACRRALLNDVNPHLINFYRWLGRGLTITHRDEERIGELLRVAPPLQRIAAGRGGRHGGSGLAVLLPESDRLQRPVPLQPPGRLQRAVRPLQEDRLPHRLRRGPAGVLAFRIHRTPISSSSPLRPDDFIYADPPYDVEFTQYSSGGFGWDEQTRAAEWLAKHPGPVVLSNQRTERIEKLYRKLGFTIAIKTAPRLISCTGDRTPARKCSPRATSSDAQATGREAEWLTPCVTAASGAGYQADDVGVTQRLLPADARSETAGVGLHYALVRRRRSFVRSAAQRRQSARSCVNSGRGGGSCGCTIAGSSSSRR